MACEPSVGFGPILRVVGLKTYFHLRDGTLQAVDDISFEVGAGKTLCIVGESGSGKSVTALSIMGLIDPPGRIEAGSIYHHSENLLELPEDELEGRIRGNRIGMIFQDPMSSLNPSFTIGDQVAEGLVLHRGLTRNQARQETIDVLRLVGIPDAEARYDLYPHQFSGGMRQRAMIAAAIICEPDLLIADEPTTALDVTIQAQILRLLVELKDKLNSSLLMITHDLGVVASMADDVLVMYAGKIVESGTVEQMFDSPSHPYTQGLLNCVINAETQRDGLFEVIPGVPLVPINPGSGCRFQDRCSLSFGRCGREEPVLLPIERGHYAACHLCDSAT